ncbi:hypothetical protein N9E91_00205 [Alphaproteobacteria bacterium]|nr:hypothetical protein [Alphaproteobacteria bacterium]
MIFKTKENHLGGKNMVDLKPASENPWYQLATLAGNDHPANVHLWNGYQRELLERANIFDPTDEDMSKLPELGKSDLERVQQIDGLPSQMAKGWMIQFGNTAFPPVDFSNFLFGFRVSFLISTFDGITKFTNATFSAGATFLDAKFGQLAIFKGANFSESMDFTVIEDAGYATPMYFPDATFNSHPPRFFGRKMHEDTDWTGAVWPKTADDENQLKSNIRAYEQLSLSARELGKTSDEHLFFCKEMECRRVLVRFEKKCLHRFASVTPFWIFRTFSSYGYSFERPAGWLLFLWLLGPIGYFLYFSFCHPLSGIGWSSILQDSMIFSTANMLPFFGFHSRFPLQLLDVESGLIFLFSVGQTILGFILLFFLGLGLRNRFRLK